MTHNNWLYIAVMFAVTYAIRALPLVLVRGRIQNRFIRSFLYYVPYVTLSVMTFPAILEATASPLVGLAAMAVGVALAYAQCSLPAVAAACCGTVFVLEALFL